MAKDWMDYQKLVQQALLGVVRAALVRVKREGLPGNHHFYIAFRTDHPGVEISDALKARYPHEMTIVLQHQFWDLEVEDDRFSVSLSFNKVTENLSIPYAAINGFFDPSVQFGLQFEPGSPMGEVKAQPTAENETGEKVAPAKLPAKPEAQPETTDGTGEVVSLEEFRKK